VFAAAALTAAAVAVSNPHDTGRWIARTRESINLTRRLHWYRLALEYRLRNPERDARHAIAAGDVRLLAGATLGEFIPGAPINQTRSLDRRYGARVLYAGCTPDWGEDPYRRAANEYMFRYNQVILAKVTR
jgi:hypothetical protein